MFLAMVRVQLPFVNTEIRREKKVISAESLADLEKKRDSALLLAECMTGVKVVKSAKTHIRPYQEYRGALLTVAVDVRVGMATR